MSFDSPVLFLLSFALLVAISGTWLFRGADTPPSAVANRVSSLDGLRGVLAMSVFFHHAVIYHGYLASGVWRPPTSHLFFTLGPLAVAMFFMITAYLFFGQMLRVNGLPNWRKLYIGRLARIGPLYCCAAALMICLVFASQRFRLHESIARVGVECASWLAFGMAPWSPVNGNEFPDFWIAGVSWSIRYEWLFYLALPAVALLARRPRVAFGAIVVVLCLLLSRHAARAAVGGERPGSVLICLFLVGMLSAAFRIFPRRFRMPQLWSSALALVLISIALHAREPYTWVTVVCLGGFFYLVCEGCTLFGLLTLRPVRRMGDISYGIYLLQGFALALCLLPAPLSRLALSSVFTYWVLVCISGVFLLMLATFAHIYIERPAIAWGKSRA